MAEQGHVPEEGPDCQVEVAEQGPVVEGPDCQCQVGVAEQGPDCQCQVGVAEQGPDCQCQVEVAEQGPDCQCQVGVVEQGPDCHECRASHQLHIVPIGIPTHCLRIRGVRHGRKSRTQSR